MTLAEVGEVSNLAESQPCELCDWHHRHRIVPSNGRQSSVFLAVHTKSR